MTSFRYVSYFPYVACVALDENPALYESPDASPRTPPLNTARATGVGYSLRVDAAPCVGASPSVRPVMHLRRGDVNGYALLAHSRQVFNDYIALFY